MVEHSVIFIAHSLLIGLGNNVTLVGQRIDGDISWMQLKKGVHYAKVVELSEEFRTYNERFNDYTYYSLAKEVYGVFGHLMHDDRNHNPLEDAQFSMKLYVECVSKGRQETLDNRPPAGMKSGRSQS